MALSYRARRRLALLTLLVALPVYIVVAVNAVDYANALWGRQSILVELLIFVALGVLWALPLKRLFHGIGQPDPNAPQEQEH